MNISFRFSAQNKYTGWRRVMGDSIFAIPWHEISGMEPFAVAFIISNES